MTVQRLFLDIMRYVQTQVRQESILLFPLRLFVAVGWLRAGAEKALNPQWWDGHALAAWLLQHLPASPYPAYAALLRHEVVPFPTLLALIVMSGQLLVGLGVLTGTCTRAALLAGMFMNLNFVAAGAPSPSAFYLVIQAALLTGGAGLVFSVDRWWASRRVRDPLAFLTALKAAALTPSRRRARQALRLLPLIMLPLLAFWSLRYAHDFSPAGSVEDPAIILAVASFFAAGCALIAVLRGADTGAVPQPEPRVITWATLNAAPGPAFPVTEQPNRQNAKQTLIDL